jgi:malate dehydrogenase (oxaloacetate-decarboxylating)(NADP+)
LFGKDSLIPSPFDPRLILRVAPAVAKAAMDSGVAARPITDFLAYIEKLQRFVFRSGFIMRNIFAEAKKSPRRVIYADGEDERVLRAAQVLIEEGIAKPILVGRPAVIEARLKRYGLSIKLGSDLTFINPEDDPRYRDYVATLAEVAGRKGITPDAARTLVRTSTTVIAALAVQRGEADAMICGLEGRYRSKLRHIRDIIGLGTRSQRIGRHEPDDHLARHRVSHRHPRAGRSQCRRHCRDGSAVYGAFGALRPEGQGGAGLAFRFSVILTRRRRPRCAPRWTLCASARLSMEIDGEMQADTALIEAVRQRKLPSSTLSGEANLLVMPDLSSANIAYQTIKVFGDSLPVGPILLGTAKPA